MTNAKPNDARPSVPYTDEDVADVLDNPEWTAEDFANARPLAEVLPELAAEMERLREERDKAGSLVTLSVDRSILEAIKAGGPGWEARIDEALRRAAGL